MNFHYLCSLLCFVSSLHFKVSSLPSEWKKIYEQTKFKKILAAPEFVDIAEIDTELKLNLSKCVDFDFRHDEFITFCMLIAMKSIEKNKCESKINLECILATYYMNRHFESHFYKEDRLKQKIKTKLKEKQERQSFIDRIVNY